MVSQSPVDELRKKLVEKRGEQVKIKYKTMCVRGGYKTTVIAPIIGYTEGKECSRENEAKNSAAREALKLIDF